MPLTQEEKETRQRIAKEYLKKHYSPKRAYKIANAVVYSRRRKLESA